MLDDYMHLSLSHRYQLDFEEYEYQADGSGADGNIEGKRTISELTRSLKTAKKYVHYSGFTNDFHIKRDALKKLMNIYLEIHSMSDTVKGKHNHALSSRAGHTQLKDNDNEAIMEELACRLKQ